MGSFIVPFLFSFHPKLRFYKEWKYFFPALLFVAAAFVLWDHMFTLLGIWVFNPMYVTDIYLGELPIEEIMFFICIPYACVFTYHCLSIFYKFKWPPKFAMRLTSVLILLLIGVAFFNTEKSYTFYTFIFLAVFLSYFITIDKIFPIERVYSVWLILLIPFLVVNGILTGTGIDEPVVWYNNEQNLGIRILTIPVEDIFYGFLLFASIVFLTEKIKFIYKK